jgi:membrane protease YdiL (CAAX protease family)
VDVREARRPEEEKKVNVNGRGSLVGSSGGREARRSAQYSLAKILGVWALAAVPMGLLGWLVFPRLAPDLEADPLGAGVTRVVLLTLGLVWLFVLSLLIVRREEGDLRWATVKRRLRLTAPRDPTTGAPRLRLWLWVVPFLVAVVVVELVLNTPLEIVWVAALPYFAEPAGYSFDTIFGSREILQRLEGAWWFFALFVVNAALNTILGEEFLFRGVLLPRMEGVFGRWSWVANGVNGQVKVGSPALLVTPGRAVGWRAEVGHGRPPVAHRHRPLAPLHGGHRR